MSVLVVGLSYKGVPLDVLERFTFDRGTLPKALHHVRSADHVREAAILSTCNRVEVYALVTGFHAGVAALRGFLSDFQHVPASELAGRTYALYEEEAVAHLFEVASGIDSMVVGEPQILAQVREAFRAADEEGAVGPVLSALFRQAIRVGRRARAETEIGRSARTFALAGLALARSALGRLDGRTVLILGAGKMSGLSARTIAAEGAHVLVANRTPARARAAAGSAGGRSVPLGELPSILASADLVLASTGSSEPLITHDMVSAAMRARGGRPIVLLDLGVPRDVDSTVAAIPGVTLKDLDDLREAVAPGAEQLGEIERVRGIVAEEVPRFTAWQRAHHLAPLIAALQERAEGVRRAELRRAAARLARLSDREREAVEALTRAMVSKLLHHPVTRLKAGAGTTAGEQMARVLRELFDLRVDEG